MPLTKTGAKVMKSMISTYKTPKKAKWVFYAMINMWKLKKKDMEKKMWKKHMM